MIFDFLHFNNYGYFIWPSFIVSFLSCLVLYISTKKELKKTEKEFFAEFKNLSIETNSNTEIKKIHSVNLVFQK